METIALPNVTRVKLTFSPERPMTLNEYTGSAWRGLFGHGLRKVSCLTRMKQCDGCLVQQQCVYSHAFETRMPGGGRFQNKPHPFLLEPPERGRRVVAAGDELHLGLTLFGQARISLPFFIQAMKESGLRGMGRDHIPFNLKQVSQEKTIGSDSWEDIYRGVDDKLETLPPDPMKLPVTPEQVVIVIETPLRMKQKGRLIGPREFGVDGLDVGAARAELYPRRCEADGRE